jgi:hypothetical protein
VLDLLRRYGATSVDRACAFATTSEMTSLRFLRMYLTKPCPSRSRARVDSVLSFHSLQKQTPADFRSAVVVQISPFLME